MIHVCKLVLLSNPVKVTYVYMFFICLFFYLFIFVAFVCVCVGGWGMVAKVQNKILLKPSYSFSVNVL